MKRTIGFRTGLIGFSFMFITYLYAWVYFTNEEALNIAFPEADRIEERTVIIREEQKERIQSLAKVEKNSGTFTYYEGIKENETIGYAVITNASGKFSYITFMVVVDPKGRIEMVEVLVYWELYGAEIRQNRFLQQFRGKTINDPLRLNSDIDAVTGATISSRAMTNGIKEILAYLCVVIRLETISQPNYSEQKKE